jgi:hypothetical protein
MSTPELIDTPGHAGSLLSAGNQSRILCSCGWQSAYWPDEADAVAEFQGHQSNVAGEPETTPDDAE